MGFFLFFLLSKNSQAKNSDNITPNANFTPLAFADVVTEEDYLSEIPVVLSATRMLQPLNTAPASVTVVTREMIDASGVQEIADLLRLVPGFQVGYFNGTSMSLAYHGFTGNYDRRLEVLIDGRSAYMPFLSTVEWLSLPLDISEIEKIEVVRSSNAPVYGANAMQGVINIVTRKVFEDEGFMLEGRWATYDMSGAFRDMKNRDINKLQNRVEDKKYLLRFASSVADMDYRLTLGYQKDPGFENVSDSKQLNLFHLNSQYQINANDTLEAHIGTRAGNMDTFADGVPMDPYRNKSVNSQYQSVTWTRALENNEELKVQFYHNYYDQNDEVRITDSGLPFPYDFGVYYGTAERFDFEVEKVSNLLPGLRLMLGSGVRLDRIKSKYLLGGREGFIRDRSMRIFGNAEWYVTRKFIVNGGLMMEHNEQIGRYFLPRLAVNFLATPAHVFRASIIQSKRTPSLLENNVNVGVRMDDGTQIYTYHISAGNLKPERQYSAEVGYMFAPRQLDLRFDTKLFVEYIRDGILEARDYAKDPPPWVWGNNTWADIQGLESQLYFKPHRRFFLNLSHSRARLVGIWNKSINLEGEPRERDLSNTIPKDTFSGLFSFAVTPSLNWGVTYYYMADMAWLQDGNAIEQYDRLDTNIDWSRKISSDSQLSLTLTLQNLLDDYFEVRNYRETRSNPNGNVFKKRAFFRIRYEW